jgi:hypothetical protein
MVFLCPKCNRYSLEWNGRIKGLVCAYLDCGNIVPVVTPNVVPTPQEIKKILCDASPKDSELNQNLLAFGL